MQPIQSEQQEKLEATGRFKPMVHIVKMPYSRLTCAFSVLSVSAAFLGDIALDEEDLRMFKVDRIIDLAQRTVHTVNRTDTGNNHKKKEQLQRL